MKRFIGSCLWMAYAVSSAAADVPAQPGQSDWRLKDGYTTRRTAVLNTCKDLSHSLRGSTSLSQGTEVAIAAVGIIAGSIVVPALAAGAASKALTAGMGGVSGAVNGVQFAWSKDGLGAAARSQVYEQFRSEMKTKMTAISGASSESQALALLDELDMYCTTTPPMPIVSGQGADSKAASSQAVQALNDAAIAMNAAVADLEKSKTKLVEAKAAGDAAAAQVALKAVEAQKAAVQQSKEVLEKAQMNASAAIKAEVAQADLSASKQLSLANDTATSAKSKADTATAPVPSPAATGGQPAGDTNQGVIPK